MATIKFEKPPIVELVCEIRFNLNNTFDATIPGMLYGKIEKDFPVTKQRNIAISIPKQGGKPGETEVIVSPLAQFFNKKENMLVQAGGNILSVNYVKDYPAWKVIKPNILGIYKTYLGIAKPKGIQRIALKTINKIYIPGTDFGLTEYFKLYPHRPEEGMTNPVSNFNMHMEMPYKSGKEVMIVNHATILSDREKHTAFMLDYEHVMNKSDGLELDKVEPWLEIAHNEITQCFLHSTTEKLQKLFK